MAPVRVSVKQKTEKKPANYQQSNDAVFQIPISGILPFSNRISESVSFSRNVEYHRVVLNMEEWVVFVTNHWILASLLGVVLFAFIMNEMIGGHFGSKQEVSAERAVQLMNHQEAVVFDIRAEAAFLDGHIVGAEHVTAASLDKKMGNLQKYHKKPVIIATATGLDAAKMVTLLQQKGFLQIFILSGGVQGWKSAGMPLIKS